MICEFVSNEADYLNGRFTFDVLICCLCLQEAPSATTWTVRSTDESSYVICSDCRTTYSADPELAWMEAHHWVIMLEALIPEE